MIFVKWNNSDSANSILLGVDLSNMSDHKNYLARGQRVGSFGVAVV